MSSQGRTERAFAAAEATRAPAHADPSPTTTVEEQSSTSQNRPSESHDENKSSAKQIRQVHNVSTLAFRRNVLSWMTSDADENGEKGIVSRACK